MYILFAGADIHVLDSHTRFLEDSSMPKFAESIPNITVSVGKDALLSCVVENLNNYKVSF